MLAKPFVGRERRGLFRGCAHLMVPKCRARCVGAESEGRNRPRKRTTWSDDLLPTLCLLPLSSLTGGVDSIWPCIGSRTP